MRKPIIVLLILLCAALALFSSYMVFSEIREYKEGSEAYDELTEFVEHPKQTEPETKPSTEPEPSETESMTEPEEPTVVFPAVDFTALREKAPDVIGWISLPDTAINYPVVQADNNDYYLRRLYDGTYNQAGCLFADYRSAADLSGRNTVIYGHNMRDGSMFSTLREYAAQEYYEAHPTMYLITPDCGYIVEIFAAFTASPSETGSDTSPWRVEWPDKDAFSEWLTIAAERSAISTGITVNSDNRILTLSTCTNSGKDRFLVMGKLTAVNETE